MDKTKNKLLLIDSSALIYRAFYALPPLTDRDGNVVNAVYGFASAFLNILRQTEPSHVIFAFDAPKPTFRSEKYKEYKATRVKAPDSLYTQIPISKKLVSEFAFPGLEKAGYEADDIIGTCANKFLKAFSDGEVVIATADMDTLQLINNRISVFALVQGIREGKLYKEKEVFERYGLKPGQMNDYKALFGDPSDNIKGIKGIGKKTATDLLQEYNDISNLFRNLDRLKPRIKNLLETEHEQAILNKELVTLYCDVPVECNWEESEFSTDKLKNATIFLDKMAFNTLIKRVNEWGKDKEKANNIKGIKTLETESLFSVNPDQIIDISSKQNLTNNFIPEIEKNCRFVYWIGKGPKGFGVVFGKLASVDEKIQKYFFIPISLIGEIDPQLWENCEIWGFDQKIGIKESFPYFSLFNKSSDIRLKTYLIQPPLIRRYSFKEIVWFFIKQQWEEPKKQLSLLDGDDGSYSWEKIFQYLNYVSRMAKVIDDTFNQQIKFQKESNFVSEIFPHIKNKINEKTINFIYEEIEKPLGRVLGTMELAGIKIDQKLLNELRISNKENINKLKTKIFEISGRSFNLDSPSQLAIVLYEDLKLSVEATKRGRSGHFSTAASVLEKMENLHPIIPLLLNYREQRKFQTTYLEVIPELIDKKNQRLCTSFDQTGTVTGRLSSSNPNLQNIPLQPINKDSNIGVRHAFIAEDGFSLVSLDYSQIEIRIAAHLTGEQKLIEAFERGEDIHSSTAAAVNHLPLEQVTAQMRQMAKALNFGIIYGISPFGFARSANMNEVQAKSFIENYFKEFPNIFNYMEKAKSFAHQNEFVETIYGRRRNLPEVNQRNRMLQQSAERMAINMPLQGTAADIMKKALIEVHDHLENNYVSSNEHPLERKVRILLSIHDEIILEVKNDLVSEIKRDVAEIMENIAKEVVPLKVDIEIGKNWGEIS